ncbi:hypothetical protein, partial [Gallibacterium anatis]|uniref:hypothetical protein n=1 Tax=Gallibacterium anatis TaxID=750 RepID=UPI00300506BE
LLGTADLVDHYRAAKWLGEFFVFESPFCHAVAVKMGTSLKILRQATPRNEDQQVVRECVLCLLSYTSKKVGRL